jgi:hypothetical protein
VPYTVALRHRDELRVNVQPEQLYKRLPVVFTTDRPEAALLPFVTQRDRRFSWAPQLISAFLPPWNWYAAIAPALKMQLEASLLDDFPVSIEEIQARQLDHLIPQTLDLLVTQSLRVYLALVINLGGDEDERAFELSTRELEMRLNPSTCLSYTGCYLYGFSLQPPGSAVVELSDHIQIRPSTFRDVVLDAPVAISFSNPEGDYLPPSYILTLRTSSIPLYARVLEGIAAEEPSDLATISDCLTALRLVKPGYVGHGRIRRWHTGMRFSSWHSAIPDDAAVEQIRAGSRPNIAYELGVDEIEELKQILRYLGEPECRSRLATAITRLNDSYRRGDLREQVIDLVVALENIFGEETTGQTTEVGYRLRMRAARYLGASAAERRTLRKFLSDLYELRSKIVHGDPVDAETVVRKRFKRSLGDVVSEAENLVRIALKRMVQNPSHSRQDFLNDLLLGIEDE